MPQFSLFHGRYDDIIGRAAQSVAERRGSTRDPFSPAIRETLVAPSQGAADALADAIFAKLGHAFTQIDIVTPEELARRIVNGEGDFPRIAGSTDRYLAMNAAVQRTEVGELEGPGIASILLRSWRDLRDSNLKIDALERATRKGAVTHPDRLKAVYSVWTRFEEILSRSGAIDDAELLRRATGHVESSGFETRVSILGFYDATRTQLAFLEALITRGLVDEVYFPVRLGDLASPDASFAFSFFEKMIELGGESVEVPDSRSYAKTTIACHLAPREQIREIARRVAAKIAEGVVPERVGIVCRSIDERDRTLLDQYARGFGFTINQKPGTPLRSHRMIRGLRILLRAREDNFPRGDVFELLDCGFWQGAFAPSVDRAGELDRATRRGGIPGGAGDALLHAIETAARDNPRAESSLRQYGEIVEQLERIAPRGTSTRKAGDWAKTLESLIGLFRIDDDLDLAVVEAVSEIGRALTRHDRSGVSLTLRQLGDLIESAEELGRRRTPGDGVWFGDVMRLRGRSFDHLFAFSLEEQRFPQGRTPDPIITDRDRFRLGLRTIGDGLAEERLLFSLTTGAAKESIHLAYSRTDWRGKSTRPSRFVKALASGLHPEDERAIAADFSRYLLEQKTPPSATRSKLEARLDSIRDGDLDGARISNVFRRQVRLASSAATRSSYDGYLTETDSLRETLRSRLERIAPTRLEDYGECPQRFLLRRLLFVQDVEDPEREIEIEVRKKGILSHQILERFYRKLEDRDYLEASEHELTDRVSKRLEESIAAETEDFDRDFPPFIEPIRAIERGALSRVLEEFVIRDLAELAQSDFRPLDFERTFGADEENDPVTIELGDVVMSLRGQIDRVDHDPSQKRYRVVDYKYGTGSRHEGLAKKIEHGQALQLPLYAIAAMTIYNTPPDRISGMIKPLRTRARAERFAFDLGEKKDALDKALEKMVTSILSGAFPAFVAKNDYTCTYCPVSHSCRTRSDPREKSYVQNTFGNALALLAPEEDA